MRGLPSPWWRVSTFALLIVAFAIAVDRGTKLGAVIVGVLAIPSALFLAAWLYAYARKVSASAGRLRPAEEPDRK